MDRIAGGQAALPATCGELVQGTLDGVPCLVSCPITLWATAQIIVDSEPSWQIPADAPKTTQALRAALEFLGRTEQGVTLRLSSPIPRGRGYGSSTADIGATLYALGQALGQPLAPADVARLAVSVEPSDSTMFPGLTLFDHRRGSFYEHLGSAPAMNIIVLDPGGEIDTIAFNRCDHRDRLRHLADQHREAFTLLRHGLRRGDMQAIGQAATLSARAHQSILHNPLLETALSIADDVGALGVCRAHSGTILGLLVDPTRAAVADVFAYVRRSLASAVGVACYSLTGGGPQTARIRIS